MFAYTSNGFKYFIFKFFSLASFIVFAVSLALPFQTAIKRSELFIKNILPFSIHSGEKFFARNIFLSHLFNILKYLALSSLLHFKY